MKTPAKLARSGEGVGAFTTQELDAIAEHPGCGWGSDADY